jgi:hypothetical protein
LHERSVVISGSRHYNGNGESMTPALKYRLHGMHSEQLQTAVGRLFAELKTDGRLRSEAAASGLDLDAVDTVLLQHSATELIEIKPQGAGLDPATVAVIVAVAAVVKEFSPVAAKVTLDCWNLFILPRLKRDFGEDSIIEDTEP